MGSKIQERKELREKLLKELYDHHFSGSRKAKPIAEEIEDIEVRQAYLYLEDKGYISIKDPGHPAFAAAGITSYGIDYVEENELAEEGK
ncbi:MAG: hypothetical protein ACI35R_13125 [Bacillus sp. (in: firmicutes)]